LLFHAEVRRALHRRQERPELTLFFLEQVDALALRPDHPIHEVTNLLLTR